jgi:hypothetical protein
MISPTRPRYDEYQLLNKKLQVLLATYLNAIWLDSNKA